MARLEGSVLVGGVLAVDANKDERDEGSAKGGASGDDGGGWRGGGGERGHGGGVGGGAWELAGPWVGAERVKIARSEHQLSPRRQ